jgi:hypothetical protein
VTRPLAVSAGSFIAWRSDRLNEEVLVTRPALYALFLLGLVPAVAFGQTTQPVASEPTSPVVRPLRAARSIKRLQAAPLYSFSEKDVDSYLGWLGTEEPDPIRRVIHLARKNIGQPYEIFLLGEGPFETYDPDPLYCLDKSDCVTFVEHTYAMALSRDWPGFFRTLQRLRYKDGKIGMLTRNHESVADWDPNNAWLFEEITGKLSGEKVTAPMRLIWKPSEFFDQFGIGQDLPDVTVNTVYIPRDKVESILPGLKEGDIVHVVRGSAKAQWVGHFGLVAHGPKGEVNMIHSAEPAVREQGLMDYLEKNPKTLGYKFLRLRPNPQAIVEALP